MEKKIGIDLWIACICAAIMSIAWIYMEKGKGRIWTLAASGAVMVLFLLLAVFEKSLSKRKYAGRGGRREGRLPGGGQISRLILLSDEDTELMAWDMYGKTSLVIGRDVGENQVDVNLAASPYASMVDVEHAVLNYSGGEWYVEDVGSRNGIGIKKAQDGRTYRLSRDTPCRVEAGDILLVGMNRLLLR